MMSHGMKSPLALASFCTPLLITATFSFLATKGAPKAATLLSEQLGPNTFALFACISITFTGFMGAFHPKARTPLSRATSRASVWAANVAFGLAGALVGWGIGLLFATGPGSTPQQLAEHIGLVSFMALIALAPARAFEQISFLRNTAQDQIFLPQLYNRIVRLILFIVGCMGTYGFWQYWQA